MNEIVLHWDLTEKEIDQVCTAVLVGIQDSTQKSREIARIAYLNIYQRHQKKAETLIKDHLSPNLIRTLAKAEKELSEQLQREKTAAAAEEAAAAAAIDATEEATNSAATAAGFGSVGVSVGDSTESMLDAGGLSGPGSVSGIEGAGGVQLMTQDAGDLNPNSSSTNAQDNALASPAGIALRRRRQSIEESASEAIQAIVRGKLSRKSVASPSQRQRKALATPAVKKSPGQSPPASASSKTKLSPTAETDQSSSLVVGEAPNINPAVPSAEQLTDVLAVASLGVDVPPIDIAGTVAVDTAVAASPSSSPVVYNLLSPKSNTALRPPMFSPEPPQPNRSSTNTSSTGIHGSGSVGAKANSPAVATADNSPAFTLTATPEPPVISKSAPHSAVRGVGSGLKTSHIGSAMKVVPNTTLKSSGLRAANLPKSASKSRGDKDKEGSDEEGSTVSTQSKMSQRSVRSTRSAPSVVPTRLTAASKISSGGGFGSSSGTSSRLGTSTHGNTRASPAATSARISASPSLLSPSAKISTHSAPTPPTATSVSASASVSGSAAASSTASTANCTPTAPPRPPSGGASSTPDEHFVRPPSSIYVGCRVSINQKAMGAGSAPGTPTTTGTNNAAATAAAAAAKASNPIGIVRFIGFTSFAPGYWLGIELLAPLGKNNGSVHGVSYFKCMDNYGIFTRAKLVTVLSAGQAAEIKSPGQTQTQTLAASRSSDEEATHYKTKSLSQSHITPPRHSRTPSLSKEEPPYTPFALPANGQIVGAAAGADSSNSSSDTWSDDQKLSSLLKIKIAKMMFLLNKQVEIAEELENCWNSSGDGATVAGVVCNSSPTAVNLTAGSGTSGSINGMAKYLRMKEEIDEMVTLEKRCIDDFTARLESLS